MDLIVSKEGDVELESQHNLKEVYIELHRLPSNPLKVTRSGPSETVLERRRSRRVPSGTKVQPGLSNKEPARLQCGTCGQILPSIQMYSHLKHHIYMASFIHGCPICPQYFKELDHLYKHLDLHSQPSVNDSVTEAPDMSTTLYLISSEEEHQSPNEVKVFGSCRICNKSFNHRQSLHRHMKLHEKSVRQIGRKGRRKKFSRKCPCCNTDFQRQDVHRSHLKKCKDVLEKFSCGKCKLKFFYKWQLSRHELKIHAKQTSFQCFWCLQFFTKNLYLKRHFSVHFKGLDYTEVMDMRNCFVKLEPPPTIPKLNKIKKKVRFNLKPSKGKSPAKPKPRKRRRKRFQLPKRKSHSRKLVVHHAENLKDAICMEIPEDEVNVVAQTCKCSLCAKEFALQVSLLSHYMFAHAGRKPLRILN